MEGMGGWIDIGGGSDEEEIGGGEVEKEELINEVKE